MAHMGLTRGSHGTHKGLTQGSNGAHKGITWGSYTDNGHSERAFFQKFKTFGLGQTNWAEILEDILAISSQTIGTILAL